MDQGEGNPHFLPQALSQAHGLDYLRLIKRTQEVYTDRHREVEKPIKSPRLAEGIG